MVDLPRGTVTFLFTDIRGGTALRKLATASTARSRRRVSQDDGRIDGIWTCEPATGERP
jgi:hypothetical protein